MVGDWLGETLGVLVSPLNAIGDAIQWVADGIVNEFQSMGRNLSDWFDGVSDNFTSITSSLGTWFSDIGTWFSDLGSDIGSWFGDLGDSLGQFFGDLFDDLADLLSKFVDLLDYINPLSEKNFVRVLFIPEHGYFSSYADEIKSAVIDKFPVIQQSIDTWQSLKTAVTDRLDGWKGFTVDLSKYGAGTLTIVDPTFVNYVAPKLRFWIGGSFYFFTFLFIIKRSSQLIGAGR